MNAVLKRLGLTLLVIVASIAIATVAGVPPYNSGKIAGAAAIGTWLISGLVIRRA